jgi:cytochrome c peroxidase
MSRWLLLIFVCIGQAHSLDWSEQERALIRSLGPWPPAWQGDASNRFSQNAEAIVLGTQLFFDRRLSQDSLLACGDCHRPDASFADGIALNRGIAPLTRHTPSLLNLRYQHWFGWDGANDSLWAQSLRPITNPDEMNGEVSVIRATLEADGDWIRQFERVTDVPLGTLSDEQWLVTIGKLLAAYQETLITPATRFDAFRDQLLAGTNKPISPLTALEQSGLKLFLNDGNCMFCHGGPAFTFGEFGDIGVTFFTATGIDKGRYGGIQLLKESPFTLLGKYNDNPDQASGIRTKTVERQHKNWGEFRVPSLRNVANTAPYMHNGSLPTLMSVIDFYSELNEERLHADGEQILKPLNLTDSEKAALAAFLRTL